MSACFELYVKYIFGCNIILFKYIRNKSMLNRIHISHIIYYNFPFETVGNIPNSIIIYSQAKKVMQTKYYHYKWLLSYPLNWYNSNIKKLDKNTKVSYAVH